MLVNSVLVLVLQSRSFDGDMLFEVKYMGVCVCVRVCVSTYAGGCNCGSSENTAQKLTRYKVKVLVLQFVAVIALWGICLLVSLSM